MYGNALYEHSKFAVKNFYLRKGELITTSKYSSIYSMRAWLVEEVEAKNSCYLVCSSSYFSYSKPPVCGEVSSLTAISRMLALEERCTLTMPDIGCPEYIGGLCWWRD